METVTLCSKSDCIRKRKHVYCYSKDKQKRWICYGKFCSMHYERKRLYGSMGSACAKVNRGEAWIGSSGYIKVSFYGKEVYVHRLVEALTNGPIPEGWHVHHKDFNKRNNHWDNLQRVPHAAHMTLHGLERNGVSR